jgi:hypothetical protein
MDDNDPCRLCQNGPAERGFRPLPVIGVARAVGSSVIFEAMAFSRRKAQEPKETREKQARRGRDPFAHLQDEREEAEAEPWFLAPDDGPELQVETGISSNLSEDDLKTD